MSDTTARLVDTGPICYTDFDGHRLVWRPCRTWATPQGEISIVTEIGEDGPSVTNSAEKVYAVLQEIRPGCRVIEHYRADAHSAESFDEILPAPPEAAGVGVHNGARWVRIPPDDLRALLGESLETTRPGGPVVDGRWPTEAEVAGD